jgi:hypothetical protein
MAQKLVAFKTKCSVDGKEYIGIAPEGIIEDVKREFYDVCEPPQIIARDVDIVEIVSPKGKMKTETRSNDNDILNVHIK